jgi:hypothetical protein
MRIFNSHLYLQTLRFFIKQVKIKSSDIYFLLTEEQREDIVRQVLEIRRITAKEA